MKPSTVFKKLTILTGFLSVAAITAPAQASSPYISCSMNYKLSGWSFVVKHYDGTGNVTCSNGQRAQVKLTSRSIGFTIGQSDIEGVGYFSELKDISEIYGVFIALEGHIGAVKSGHGQVMTRGMVSLAISGAGRGFDIGVTLGGLDISPLNR
ncbi:MAG: hypothetical protein WAT53_07975 [Nitrosomonas sp.]|nr:hypothetical protein [Nitrosomonas sp.]